jgi:hypothetical protein
LFALVLNKKNIRIAIYDEASGSLKTVHEINDDTNLSSFAEPPSYKERRGKIVKTKEIDDIKKLIKELDKGSEAIMLYVDKKGKLILTVGTYDLIKMNSTSGTSAAFENSITRFNPNASPGVNYMGGGWEKVPIYKPGVPSHITTSARYFKSTEFKLMLDPINFNLVRGYAPESINDQIKDYLETVNNSIARTQFTLNGKQYFGFYDRQEKAYIIEEIFIRN